MDNLEYCYETLNDLFDSNSKEIFFINGMLSLYGYNDDTMNNILYYLFGMEMLAFIDAYENGEL